MAANDTFNLPLYTPELDCERFLKSPTARALKHMYAKGDNLDNLIVTGYQCFYLLNSKQEPRDCTEFYHFLSRCEFNETKILQLAENYIKTQNDFFATVATNDCSQIITGFSRMNNTDPIDNQTTNTIEETIEGAVGGMTDTIEDDEELVALQLENQYLNELVICKICRIKTASIVHLPCGCLVNCKDCDDNSITTCRNCGKAVRATVQAYLS
ncbi:baculoviral IAP repeat-containing protein 7-like [Elysia marginata]|uniref:Baculoviral IAP repeat-containing protein 7-like n=1 Tax=Elysia marginata TaxID=1093978 RepID=A0AAV4J361_9GAST|nr:baculoviral IAP repeat-containing protein 7-like [Elysia marginata]